VTEEADLVGSVARGLDALATEGARPDLRDIDLRPTLELVRLMAAEDAGVPVAVGAVAEQVAAVVDEVTARMARGGRLIYVGAGSAGRIAAQDAAEVAPTFGVAAGTVVGIVAGGAGALVDAREGLEDDVDAGAADVAAVAPGPHDTVVGVTASGRTPYVLGAVRAARTSGALTVALVSNRGTALAAECDHVIDIVTGPEFIAGSTRLKAGTAQKLVLNMLSTLVMVRLGRTFGNLMVDVATHNEKLRHRALRILVEAAGVSEHEAAAALESAGGETKTALLMLLTGADAPAARERLVRADGRVRAALSAG
jgi:N-acetylmuramic acid 6-phosphate etherase